MSSNSERALAKTFREHLAMHVAWVPMTSSVSLGDYGLWRKGLFVPIGNVSEFGVALRRERGKESRLDYSSEAAVSVCAAGTSDCGPMRGELGMRFTKAGGCLVRVGRLTSARIGNLAEVARALARLPEWRRRYKLVTEVFTGEDVLIAVTAERDTELSVQGALGSPGTGSPRARAQVAANKRLGLEIVGEVGTIGLNVCRLRLGGGVALSFGDTSDDAPELVVEDMSAEPADDPPEPAAD